MFQFVSRTADEINAIQNRGLLVDGIYPVTVKDVKDRVSSTGNPMLEVRLAIHDVNGDRSILDYIVATDTMIFKLKHFCESIGCENEYKEGKLEPLSLIGLRGHALIGTQKGNMKPDLSGCYPDKNVIKDYIKKDNVPTSSSDLDVDISF